MSMGVARLHLVLKPSDEPCTRPYLSQTCTTRLHHVGVLDQGFKDSLVESIGVTVRALRAPMQDMRWFGHAELSGILFRFCGILSSNTPRLVFEHLRAGALHAFSTMASSRSRSVLRKGDLVLPALLHARCRCASGSPPSPDLCTSRASGRSRNTFLYA